VFVQPVEHSLLYLFADDFFHQILFYFGAVGGLVFLVVGKVRGQAAQVEIGPGMAGFVRVCGFLPVLE